MTNDMIESAKAAYRAARAATSDNERIILFIEFDKIRARLSPKELTVLEKQIKENHQ